MSKGIIFQYENKNGEIVKAVALNDEQHTKFSDYGKVFLRILNDDYTFKKTEEGKGLIALKNNNALTQIGFWDYLAEREMVNQQMKERAIKAFVEATDGYFIVGGTDYTHSILEVFKSKLSE